MHGKMIIFGVKRGGGSSNRRLADVAIGKWSIIEVSVPSNCSARTAQQWFPSTKCWCLAVVMRMRIVAREFCFATTERRRINHGPCNQMSVLRSHVAVSYKVEKKPPQFSTLAVIFVLATSWVRGLNVVPGLSVVSGSRLLLRFVFGLVCLVWLVGGKHTQTTPNSVTAQHTTQITTKQHKCQFRLREAGTNHK